MVIGLLVVVAALMVAAGVIDFRARRRGVRYKGVDAKSARDTQRANEADLHTRGNNPFLGGGSF